MENPQKVTHVAPDVGPFRIHRRMGACVNGSAEENIVAVQALERVRATPGFAAAATRAKVAYQAEGVKVSCTHLRDGKF